MQKIIAEVQQITQTKVFLSYVGVTLNICLINVGLRFQSRFYILQKHLIIKKHLIIINNYGNIGDREMAGPDDLRDLFQSL